MSRRGLPTLWLVAALTVPGLGAPARLPIPAVDAVVAAMLGAPALVDYDGTKALNAVRGDRAETVTALESYKRLGKLRVEHLSPESVSGRLIVDDRASSWKYEPPYDLGIRVPSFLRRPRNAPLARHVLR